MSNIPSRLTDVKEVINPETGEIISSTPESPTSIITTNSPSSSEINKITKDINKYKSLTKIQSKIITSIIK